MKSQIFLESLQVSLENMFNLTEIVSVVQLHGVYQDENFIYIVSDYLDGGDLLEFVSHAKEQVNEAVIKDLVIKLLKIIVFVHQSQRAIGNLKPTNILFSTNPASEEEKVKISDIGLKEVYSNF